MPEVEVRVPVNGAILNQSVGKHVTVTGTVLSVSISNNYYSPYLHTIGMSSEVNRKLNT